MTDCCIVIYNAYCTMICSGCYTMIYGNMQWRDIPKECTKHGDHEHMKVPKHHYWRSTAHESAQTPLQAPKYHGQVKAQTPYMHGWAHNAMAKHHGWAYNAQAPQLVVCQTPQRVQLVPKHHNMQKSVQTPCGVLT